MQNLETCEHITWVSSRHVVQASPEMLAVDKAPDKRQHRDLTTKTFSESHTGFYNTDYARSIIAYIGRDRQIADKLRQPDRTGLRQNRDHGVTRQAVLPMRDTAEHAELHACMLRQAIPICTSARIQRCSSRTCKIGRLFHSGTVNTLCTQECFARMPVARQKRMQRLSAVRRGIFIEISSMGTTGK